MSAERATTGSEPRRKVWFCKIGECKPGDVPEYGDEPMRERVERAYKLVTGEDPDFIFSGWGGELDESERAVVEDRLPDRDLQIAVAERELQIVRGLNVGEVESHDEQTEALARLLREAWEFPDRPGPADGEMSDPEVWAEQEHWDRERASLDARITDALDRFRSPVFGGETDG